MTTGIGLKHRGGNRRMKYWIATGVTLLCFCLFTISGLAGGSEQKKPDLNTSEPAQAAKSVQMTSGNQPEAYFPKANYTFEEVFEGAIVLHSFILQNRGKATLDIKEVKTS